MRFRKRALVLLAALALLPGAPTQAFWSKTFLFGAIGAHIHQDITAAALTQPYTYGGVGHSFSATAIAAINAWHSKLDTDSTDHPYLDLEHFDSESLVPGFDLVAYRRAQLMAELQKPSPDSSVVWEKVGEIAHAIQDFYSHSSWVASQSVVASRIGIADFGAATVNLADSTPPAFLLPQESIGTVCMAGGTALTSPVSMNVTTGYYPPNQPTTNPQKCYHGSPVYMGSSCGALAYTPDGINHDAPCFSWLFGNDNEIFAEAYSLAGFETLGFMTSVVNALSAANNATGYCVLLGLDPSDPTAPCYTSTPAPTPAPVNFPFVFPKVIHETEGPFAGVWTWNGSYYSASWNNGALAEIAVVSFTGASVVFQRTDVSGSVSNGLTATYTAQISPQGNSIVSSSSNVTFTWPGVAGYPASETWAANW